MKWYHFKTAIISLLHYGCTTCRLLKRQNKKLDGNCTRMLRVILKSSWKQHPAKQQLYGHLPPICRTIQVRRQRPEGHRWRKKDKIIRDILLWTSTQMCHFWVTSKTAPTIALRRHRMQFRGTVGSDWR